jgi:hypothetical protein
MVTPVISSVSLTAVHYTKAIQVMVGGVLRRRERTFGKSMEIKRKALKKESIRVTRCHTVEKYKTLKYGHPYSRKTATRHDTVSPTKQPVNGGKFAVLRLNHDRLGNGNGWREMATWSMQETCGAAANVCWKVERLTGTKESSGRGAGRLDDDRASVLKASFTAKAVPLTENCSIVR